MKDIDYHYKKMTKTPVSKLIIILGIPTTISMLITNIYNLADTYFVGTLGKSAQGAVGVLFTLQCIIQAIAFMLGHGSGTHLSKSLANKDTNSATKYVSTAYYSGFLLGLVLTIFGLIFITPFMRLLGSTETILPYALEYGLWVLLSAPFMITSLVLNNNLRYEGKAIFSMIGLCTGGILNIIGDYVLINFCHMGVYGAGLSTAVSQVISFIILFLLYKKYAQSNISFKAISNEKIIFLDIFKAGLPSLIRQGLTSISNGILNNLAKPFGDAAIAAMSVVNKFSSFILCVGLGIGQGFQPVAAFNYQAKKYTRVKKGALFTITFATCLVGVLSLISIIIPDKIMMIFQKDKSVVDIGVFAIRSASIGVLFLPLTVTVNMLYQSIRRSTTASILSLLRSGLIFIPILYILVAVANLKGIQIAQPIADFISCLISVPFLIMFLKEKFDDEEVDEIENNSLS